MARERRYLWTWAACALLALSACARAAESGPTPTPPISEAQGAVNAKVLEQLDHEDRVTRAKAASALLAQGALVLPELDAEAARAQRETKEGKDQIDRLIAAAKVVKIEQVAALIRGGEAAGGWQLSLGTPPAKVPEGDLVPLRITVINRNSEENVCEIPFKAEAVSLADYEPRRAACLYVFVRRQGVSVLEPDGLRASQEVSQASRTRSTIRPGSARAFSLVLEPSEENGREEVQAAGADLPLLFKTGLAPGAYRVQVLLRPSEKALLLASNAVTFTVAPLDWKALDRAQVAREEKQIAAAEAALEKDAALRAKMRAAAAKLDDEDWQAREDASKALAEAERLALPELERLRTSSASLEARTRAGELFEALRSKLAEGGEPQAGLRATLRLDRKEVCIGDSLKLSFEVKNVAQEARPFVRVRAFELATPYLASDVTWARAKIEIRRQDGARTDYAQGVAHDMEQERGGDTVALKPGMAKTGAAVLTLTNEGLMRAMEQAPGDAPFECDAYLAPGRYRVRVVYYAYSKGLVQDAADDLKSNWVTLDVRE